MIGTIDASYTIIADPKRTALTAEEQEQLKTLKPIDELVSALLARQVGGEQVTTVANAA